MPDVVKTFDAIAAAYDQWYQSTRGKLLLAMEVDALRCLTHGLVKPYLEVGVGGGRFALELGIEYGIDPAEAALKIAAKRGIRVARAEGKALPFVNAAFGAVFLLFTICFLRNPEKVLCEAKRTLKKGGGLVIAMINKESPWGRFYRRKKAAGHPIYRHAIFYSVDQVTQMMRETGYAPMAFASTLRRLPAPVPHVESPVEGLVETAGVVGILARLL